MFEFCGFARLSYFYVKVIAFALLACNGLVVLCLASILFALDAPHSTSPTAYVIPNATGTMPSSE